MVRRMAFVMMAVFIPIAAEAQPDCSAALEAFSYAYKAYNDCSAAGRGAQGCASETSGYNAARQRLDNCRTPAATPSPDADFKSRFDEFPRPEWERDYEPQRRWRSRERMRLEEPRRSRR